MVQLFVGELFHVVHLPSCTLLILPFSLKVFMKSWNAQHSGNELSLHLTIAFGTISPTQFHHASHSRAKP